MPPPTAIPPVSHLGIAFRASVTIAGSMKQRAAAGTAIRAPCMRIATMCQRSIAAKSPFSAAASIAWTIPVAIVRAIMVRNRPATDRGIASAIEVLIAAVVSVSPPFSAKTIIIADATDAKAASGATAAPMFAQPRAII